MANPRTKLDSVDKPTIAEQIIKSGRQIIYLNNALYPVVKLLVRLRERSRDQMGDIEATVLKLCSIGVNELDKLSFAMGIAPQRLGPIILEIVGRGLVGVNKDETLYLSELGSLSIEHGCEVIETDRSVLVCGITGRLLPKNMYSMNLANIQELRDIKFIPDLIQESFTIPLKALDLSQIPNKKSVNLPDETISIEGVIPDSAEPNFINTVVSINKGKDNGDVTCELHYRGGSVDWLNVDQVLGFLEPLGYPNRTPESTVGVIKDHFKEIGAVVDSGHINMFNNAGIVLSDGAESLFKTKYNGRSIAFCIGCEEYPPLPIGNLNVKVIGERAKSADILRGRALTIYSAPKSRLSKQIETLRFIDEKISSYYRQYRSGELGVSTKLPNYIHKSLVDYNISFEEAYKIAEMIGNERISKALAQPTE